MSNNNYPVYPGWTTVREIGRGSFATVYEIERKIGGTIEKAALKHISIPQNDGEIKSMRQMGMDDASVTNVFEEQKDGVLNEYLLMRNLGGHTNVVNCDDVSETQRPDGGGWDIYIRMELLTAMTEKIKNYPGDQETIRIGTDLCSALIHCEKHSIIHRDIKPQNIFVSPDGDYKLGDFGIARTIESASHGASTIGIGTNNYMAPEVKNGNENYNHTVDLYSLGLVLYWLMNEMRLPFCPLPPVPLRLSDIQNSQARRMRGEALPPPKHGDDALKAIVLKACAFDPKERYQSAAEMKQALEALGKAVSGEAAPDLLMEEEKTVGGWLPLYKNSLAAEVVSNGDSAVKDGSLAIPTENVDRTERKRGTVGAEHKREDAAQLPLAEEPLDRDDGSAESKKIVKAVLIAACIVALLAAVVAMLLSNGPSDAYSNNSESNRIENTPSYSESDSSTPNPTTPNPTTPSPTAAPVEEVRDVPGKEAFTVWMEGVDYSLIAPKQSGYLSDYLSGVINAPKKYSVYCFAGPNHSSVKLKKTMKHGETVRIMARQNGFYLVRVDSTARVGWVSCDLIAVDE